MRYYEHYVERLKESLASGPMGAAKVELISLFDRFPPEDRFQMVQTVQRLLGSLDPTTIDIQQVSVVVRDAVANAANAAAFKANLDQLVAKRGSRS